jgi:hypothetical protein
LGPARSFALFSFLCDPPRQSKPRRTSISLIRPSLPATAGAGRKSRGTSEWKPIRRTAGGAFGGYCQSILLRNALRRLPTRALAILAIYPSKWRFFGNLPPRLGGTTRRKTPALRHFGTRIARRAESFFLIATDYLVERPLPQNAKDISRCAPNWLRRAILPATAGDLLVGGQFMQGFWSFDRHRAFCILIPANRYSGILRSYESHR